MKILIVDDNPRMRAILHSALEKLGSRVEAIYECGDGEEAIEQYGRVNPDWVLMDIGLPGMDGLHATRRIVQADPEAKVLIVTQYNDSSYREEAEAAGARGYVLKENLATIPRLLEEHDGSAVGIPMI